jgi:uncharacterized protein
MAMNGRQDFQPPVTPMVEPMNSTALAPKRPVMSFRFVRRLHLWIGAWGAVAAILFGFTGFVQNHRAILKLPQGDSIEVAQIELPVPAADRQSPEALRDWLRDAQHLDIARQRVEPGKQVEFNGQRIRQPAHWMYLGGNARTSLQGDYSEGANLITLRTTVQSPLAVITRLHRGVGLGLSWILLTDSFALAMVMLGISGILLWSRGRTKRQMVFSVVSAAIVLLVVVGGYAVF